MYNHSETSRPTNRLTGCIELVVALIVSLFCSLHAGRGVSMQFWRTFC